MPTSIADRLYGDVANEPSQGGRRRRRSCSGRPRPDESRHSALNERLQGPQERSFEPRGPIGQRSLEVDERTR